MHLNDNPYLGKNGLFALGMTDSVEVSLSTQTKVGEKNTGH
jgi:hypothetical protein